MMPHVAEPEHVRWPSDPSRRRSSTRTSTSGSGPITSSRVQAGPLHRHEHDYVIVDVEGDRIAAEPVPGIGGEYDEYIEAPVKRGRELLPAGRWHRAGDQRRRDAVPNGHRRAQARLTWACSSATSCAMPRAVTPDAPAATHGRLGGDVRPARRGRPTAPAVRSGELGIGHGDRVVWWGDTTLAVLARLRRRSRSSARCSRRSTGGSSADEARAIFDLRASGARRRPTPTGRAARRRRRPDRDHERARRAHPRRERRGRARARRARSARHLLHERQHRRAEGRRALAPGQLPPRASRASASSATAAPCACSRCSTWPGWSLAPRARGRPAEPIHLVRTPDAATLARASRSDAGRRVSTRSPRCGRASSSTASTATTSRALREADTGTSATPPELIDAIRRRAPRRRHPDLLRLDRGGTGHHARPRRPRPQAGQRRAARSPVVELRLSDDGEVCLRSELLMDGYFDDPDATAAALDAGRLVPHRRPRGARRRGVPLDRRPRARRAPHRRRDGRARRGRGGRSSDHPAVAEVAVVGMPDTEWGEIVVCGRGPGAGRVDLDLAASGPTAGAGWRGSSTRAGWRSRRAAPHRGDRPGPADVARRAHSGPETDLESAECRSRPVGAGHRAGHRTDDRIGAIGPCGRWPASPRGLRREVRTAARRRASPSCADGRDIDPRVSDIVARRPGLSNQAFYRHFRGKDELLVAVLDDGRQRLLDDHRATRWRSADRRRRPGAAHGSRQCSRRRATRGPPPRPAVRVERRPARATSSPTRRQRSRRAAAVEPLRARCGGDDAGRRDAIYHLAMGTRARHARRAASAPTRVATSSSLVEFAVRGVGLGT